MKKLMIAAAAAAMIGGVQAAAAPAEVYTVKATFKTQVIKAGGTCTICQDNTCKYLDDATFKYDGVIAGCSCDFDEDNPKLDIGDHNEDAPRVWLWNSSSKKFGWVDADATNALDAAAFVDTEMRMAAYRYGKKFTKVAAKLYLDFYDLENDIYWDTYAFGFGTYSPIKFDKYGNVKCSPYIKSLTFTVAGWAERVNDDETYQNVNYYPVNFEGACQDVACDSEATTDLEGTYVTGTITLKYNESVSKSGDEAKLLKLVKGQY